MNELLIRVWDSESEKMLHPEGLSLLGWFIEAESNKKDREEGEYYSRFADNVQMLYIGQLDMDCKKIFDGDIITWTHANKGWKKIGPVFMPDYLATWSVGDGGGSFPWKVVGHPKIIGNIHEDPSWSNDWSENENNLK